MSSRSRSARNPQPSARERVAEQQRRAAQRRRLGIAGGLAAVVVAGGVGYLVLAGGEGGGGIEALAPVEGDPGVVHVHGLGVDPADGVLYAATHSGLFRLPEQGEAERVANRAQDTMGFSVVGPASFIGSGHPDFREDKPPLLGLIESTDRGESWDDLSLGGEVDFHALHAAHGQVYGFDSTSQTFMVSKDRKEWDRRAQLPMRDFAVSPGDPDVVLATTQQGLARSADGGRTFAPVQRAPVLAVLGWAEDAVLYGVAPDGTVHTSADGGATWAATGSAEMAPEAFTVDARDGKQVLYVAGERGILASSDGGKSFTMRYAE